MPYAQFTNIKLPTRTSVSYEISTDTVSALPEPSSANMVRYLRGNYSIYCTSPESSCTETYCIHKATGKDAVYTVRLSVSCTTYTSVWDQQPYDLEYSGPYNTRTEANEELQKLSSSGNYFIKMVNQKYYIYETKYGPPYLRWDKGTERTLTHSFSFYPPPGAFSFTNLSKGSKIGNATLSLSSFFSAATKWIRWKNQNINLNFPYSSFCNSSGYISAGQISLIYEQFDRISPYKQGDTINVSMFEAIEGLINTGISA